MRMCVRPLTAAAIALVVASSTAGCTNDQAEAESSSSSLGLSVPAEPEPGIRDRAQGLRAESGYLSRAVSIVTSQCMKQLGYSYPVESASAAAGARTPRELNYGLSVEEASANGYTSISNVLTVSDEGSGAQGPSNPAPGAPSREEALFGDPKAPPAIISDPIVGGTLSMSRTGCLADAIRAIYGSIEQGMMFETLVGNFAEKAWVEAATDPAHVRLNQDWSACMASAGFPNFSSPDFAISKARGLGGGNLAGLRSGAPKRIAVEDAKCEASLDYAAKRRHLEDRYLTAMMRRFEAEIAGVQETQREAVARARTVLSS